MARTENSVRVECVPMQGKVLVECTQEDRNVTDAEAGAAFPAAVLHLSDDRIDLVRKVSVAFRDERW